MDVGLRGFICVRFSPRHFSPHSSAVARRPRCRMSADPSLHGLNDNGEVQADNEKVKQLASDKGMKTAQNVAARVAGIVIPVLWFGIDFQGTADTEITALQVPAAISRDDGRSKALRRRWSLLRRSPSLHQRPGGQSEPSHLSRRDPRRLPPSVRPALTP
jgi:hypothetical protein